MMLSLRPHFVIAMLFPSRGSGQLSSEDVLGLADFVEQLVECLGRDALACGQRPQHVYQKQANPKNLRERWITGRFSPHLFEDRVAYPFPACKSLRPGKLSDSLSLLFR